MMFYTDKYARQEQVTFYFTWNVRQFVLWRTRDQMVAMSTRDRRSFNIVDYADPVDPRDSELRATVDSFLKEFIRFILSPIT